MTMPIINRKKATRLIVATIGLFIIIACAALSMRIFSNSLLFNAYVTVKYLSTFGHMAFPSSDGWLFFRPDFSDILKPWRYYSQNVKAICALSDTLRKMGIQFLVVPVPDKEAIIQAYSPFFADVVNNKRKRFLEELRQRNVNVIDLTPSFIAHRHIDQLYRKTDTHWDWPGISLGAEIVAAKIAVPPTNRPTLEYMLKDTTIMEQGDLSLIMQDSAYYPRKCRMVLTKDGSPYSDSPTSEIMIFGDSFTYANKRISSSFGAWLAYTTNRANYTYSGFNANIYGPRLLLGFLKNHKRTPKVIIWVFVSRILFEKIEAY